MTVSTISKTIITFHCLAPLATKENESIIIEKSMYGNPFAREFPNKEISKPAAPEA
ncbi:hypothetical protein SDC9_115543 [bioreactor metagenome]|uniref:Uncharacterized protein n=1 Tax=bioreactor metagenome TaxID=1076179 RepID=A0A645BT55_9ZZZZ